MPPCITLQTVIGDKINVLGKIYLDIAFGDAMYHHMTCVADVNDHVFLALDFFKENNFKLKFKNNELHSSSEDIMVFKTKDYDFKSVHHITEKSETALNPRTETMVSYRR